MQPNLISIDVHLCRNSRDRSKDDRSRWSSADQDHTRIRRDSGSQSMTVASQLPNTSQRVPGYDGRDGRDRPIYGNDADRWNQRDR